MISQYQDFNLWPITASPRNLFYRSENISCINICVLMIFFTCLIVTNLETIWMWVGDG